MSKKVLLHGGHMAHNVPYSCDPKTYTYKVQIHIHLESRNHCSQYNLFENGLGECLKTIDNLLKIQIVCLFK